MTRRKVDREVKRPRLFRVLLHDDDYTQMDFVIDVLKTIFHRTQPEAERLMLQVHQEGMCVAGVYTREIAETKVVQVLDAAVREEFPFLSTMEPE